MRKLTLYFESGQLDQTAFIELDGMTELRSVRGRTAGAFLRSGSFQWTSAVRALCLLAVKTVINPETGLLEGAGGTLAASLDFAISKQPVWLLEMFGCDSQGVSHARRMMLRTNPERKRPGPVRVAINSSYLPAESIQIIINGQPADQESLLALHNCLTDDSPWPLIDNAAAIGLERMAS